MTSPGTCNCGCDHSGVLVPGDPDARMNAYYYSFEPTGVGIVDAILSAVATAGKAYHSTESWADEDQWTSPSHEQQIQQAADDAAAALRAALGSAQTEQPACRCRFTAEGWVNAPCPRHRGDDER